MKGSRLKMARWFALLGLLVFALAGCDLLGNPTPTSIPPPPTATEPPAPQSTATGASGERPCSASDLQAVAGWQGATGSMAGGISFVNKSATACALQGRPGIHLLDSGGNLMPVANVDFPPLNGQEAGTPSPVVREAPVVLRPGGKALVFFMWSNWCGTAKGPYTLAVALPGEGGQLDVPVLDPEGTPVATTPRCDDNTVSSTIGVGVFQPPPQP